MKCEKCAGKGAVSVIALWILAILVVLAVGFAHRTRLGLKLSGLRLDKLRSYTFARAGVDRSIVEIENDTTSSNGLNAAWAHNPEIFREFELEDGGFTISFVRRREHLEEVCYGVADEERKININYASQEVLEGLPFFTGEIAASIIDWRDKNQIPLSGGAEDFYYQSLPESYSCKDSSFESLEELLMVKGVTDQFIFQVGDFITVYGDGKVNINTCGTEVLLALGLREDLVDKIISFRCGADRVEGTFDDGIFEYPSQIVPKLHGFGSLTPEEMARMNRLISGNRVSTSSQHFRINSTGWLKESPAVSKITTVVRKDEDGICEIVYWHES